MAVIASKKKQARRPAIRMVRTVLGSCCLFIFCIVLFEADVFRSTHTAKHRLKRASHISPQKLLQQDVTAAVDTGSGPKASDSTRVEMVLANLKNDAEPATMIVEVYQDWAPIGYRRFLELVQSQFYNDCRFFRVVPNFVAQFGISGHPDLQKQWRQSPLRDDPVLQSNTKGTLTFATSGPNTRTTQLFLNFKDNAYLDQQGFAPIGKIVEGLNVLEQIQDRHREQPKQPQIVQKGNAYLQQSFPELTYIQSMRVLLDEEGAGEEV